MDGQLANSPFSPAASMPALAVGRPSGVWSRLSANAAFWPHAPNRRVGDCPLPGKETAAVTDAYSWLLGISPL
jgi:hypothetical protein